MSATNAPAASPAGSAGVKIRKFPCPACGADVVWNPGASALKCPYCGAEKTIPTSAAEIKERPIEEALSAPRDTGWGAERKTVKCTRCGALTTFGIISAAIGGVVVWERFYPPPLHVEFIMSRLEYRFRDRAAASAFAELNGCPRQPDVDPPDIAPPDVDPPHV